MALQNGSLVTLTNYTQEYPDNNSYKDTDKSISNEYSIMSVSNFAGYISYGCSNHCFASHRWDTATFDETNTFFPPTSTFYPIPELQRWDGAIQIFFLSSNALYFTQPTKDPWFNVSTTLGSYNFPNFATTGNTTLYSASEPASPLGCLAQEQLCNPSLSEHSRRCTNLTRPETVGIEATALGLFPPGSNSDARITWAFNSIFYNSAAVTNIIDMLGAQALLARAGVRDGLQGPLPTNQWQKEVEHWFNTTLASLQQSFVKLARGPDDDSVLEWLVRPANTSTREAGYCKDQVRDRIHTLHVEQHRHCVEYITDCLCTIESPQHRLCIFQYARPSLHPYIWGYRYSGFLLSGANTGVHSQTHRPPSLHLPRVGYKPDASDTTPSIRGDRVWELASGVGARASDRVWRSPPKFGFEQS